MGDFYFLSSKVLDPLASDVLSILTASLHDQSALQSTINSVVNRFSALAVSSLISDSKAELDRLRLMLKIKHHLETNTVVNDNLYGTAGDGAQYKNLAQHCVAALHELAQSKSENSVGIFTTICDILGLCLLAMPSSLYYETVNSIINYTEDDYKNLSASGSRKLVAKKAMVHLKVLETVIDVSVIKKGNHLDHARLCKQFNDSTGEIDNFLLDIICVGERTLAAQALLSVVPKLISLVESNSILVKIWGQIAVFDGFNTVVELPRVILVLVSLADYFVALTPSAISFALSDDTKFWRILALGLANDDALLRKQVLYMAKRADAGKTDKAAVGGNAIARRALWSRFLVVVETLEEKQSHLAHAVLPRADRLLPPVRATNSAADPTQLTHPFALVVFRRLLRHDQPGVSKWGMLRFLRSDVHALCEESSETDTSSILRLAVSTLNTAFMFASAADGQPATEALAALASWLPSPTFSRLLQAVAVQAWNPCALLHVAHALALANPRQVLLSGDVEVLCTLATSALATSGACVRAAVHCRLLSALANLSDPAAVGLAPALAALGALDRLALARGAGSWRQATVWLRDVGDAADAEAYVADAANAVIRGDPGSPSASSPARGIVLLMDTGLVDPALVPVRDGLRCALELILARAYASTDVQDRALMLLARMLEEAAQIRPGFADRYLAMDDPVVLLAQDFSHEAINAIYKRLSEIWDLREFATADDYVFVLKHLLPCVEEKDLDRLWKTAVAEASFKSSPAIRQYLALQLLATISQPPNLPLASCPDLPSGQLLAGRTSLALPSEHLVGLLSTGSMNLAPPREPSANRDVAVLHGRLVSGSLSARWSLLCRQLAAAPPPPGEVSARLKDCIDCLQLCAGATTSHVALALALIWPSVDPDHRALALNALDAMWAAALESRRTEAFWPVIRAAVAAAFHPLLVGQAWAQKHLNKFSLALIELAQGVVGLANVLFERLALVADGDTLQTMHAVVVEGLLFGPTHRKDQRFEEETLVLIKSLGADCSVNEISEPVVGVDAKVRAISVSLLLRSTAREVGTERKAWRHKACAQLALALVERHDAITRRNSRYFADSTQHRLRHRTLQGLLLIAGGLDQPTSKMLLSWCWRCLGKSSHQRSVRCQLEWLAARLTLAWPANREPALQETTDRRLSCLGPVQFSATAKESANYGTTTREPSNPDGNSQKQESVGPALACSALVVAALVARCSCTEEDLSAGMELALASLVAQHFNQRLHAQVVFCSLWDVCTRAGFTSLLERFGAVNFALRTQPLVATGNAQRNVQRMHTDFFLTQLDALAHVSVLAVCRDIPHMTGCPERLEADDLRATGVDSAVPWRCRDESVHIAAQGVLGSEAPEEESHGDGPQDPEDDLETEADVQRKPTPAGTDPRCQRKDDGVVLVASLIDKPANLGGLCRSCDVFGASLVVPRLALTQDKAFVGLSVSSQRWVPISEVREQDLPHYLADMKRKGYTLVGAEQTAGSVPVQHVSFPRKTLLLLGNEKEGVPANLLPLLDICVEIPQHGVIRSLNVHVTGAIFLWEISRQHHLGIEPQGPAP